MQEFGFVKRKFTQNLSQDRPAEATELDLPEMRCRSGLAKTEHGENEVKPAERVCLVM